MLNSESFNHDIHPTEDSNDENHGKHHWLHHRHLQLRGLLALDAFAFSESSPVLHGLERFALLASICEVVCSDDSSAPCFIGSMKIERKTVFTIMIDEPTINTVGTKYRS